MNVIQTFNFGINEVRTAIKDNGDVYFCLTDVADVLEISRSSDLLQVQKDFGFNETPKNRGALDPKGVEKIPTPTNGGIQNITFINEPNLYRVIFRSNKEQAKQFQDWVFNEALPTIRKTGAYMSEPPQPVQPVPLTFAEALRAYADEVEAHEQTKQTLAIAEPKAQYFDKLVERNLLTNFTTTAKEFGIKRKDFINYLLGNGYIYRDLQGNLLPYATHVPHLFEVKEYSKDAHSGVQTLVTPKGRETLRLLLT